MLKLISKVPFLEPRELVLEPEEGKPVPPKEMMPGTTDFVELLKYPTLTLGYGNSSIELSEGFHHVYQTAFGLLSVSWEEFYSSRNHPTSLKKAGQFGSYRRLFSVAFIEEDVYVYSWLAIKTELKVEVRSQAESPVGYLAKEVPSFAPMAEYWVAREALLEQLDPNDTIAYLETQVDLLTRLVKDLLDKKTPSNEYLDALKEVEKNSIFCVKDVAGATAKFVEKKSKVLELQSEFQPKKQAAGK